MVQERGKLLSAGEDQLRERLELYVRHMAWLQAVPDDSKAKKTRYEILELEEEYFKQPSPLKQLPELTGFEMAYISHLQEFGFCSSNGMGLEPVSFSEIKAWADLQKIELEPFEARILHGLSVAYVAQANKSTKPDSKSPYLPEEQEKRKAFAEKMRHEALKERAKSNTKNKNRR